MNTTFVQDNQSLSRRPGTVRGLHFQSPPSAQAKLVGCLSGAILDVVVDIRVGSPTQGRVLSVELTDAGEQLYIPEGFAHGFITLTADALVSYKVSRFYDPACEGGVSWSDPALGLGDLGPGLAILSDKDAALDPLAALDSPFAWDGTPMRLDDI